MTNLNQKLLDDSILDILFEIEQRFTWHYKNIKLEDISVQKSNLYFDLNSLYQKHKLYLLLKEGDKLAILQSMFDYGEEQVWRWLRSLTVSREKATDEEICQAINECDKTFVVDLLKNLRIASDEELKRRGLCDRGYFLRRKAKTSEIFARATLMNLR